MASAIGVGLPVHEPAGNMIVDIGGDLRDRNHLPRRHRLQPQPEGGGDEFDETIVAHMKRAYNLMIGERTAEEIKIAWLCFSAGRGINHGSQGTRLSSGLPKTLTIRSEGNSRSLAGSAFEHIGIHSFDPGTLPAGTGR